MTSRKRKNRRGPGVLMAAWGSLSFMGMALVAVQDMTTPDTRTGQRMVRPPVAPAPVRVTEAPEVKPIRIWRERIHVGECGQDDWGCELGVLADAGMGFDKHGNIVRRQ